MRLYHRTYHHEAILEHGFRDAEGTYLTTEKHSGVWVSDRPLNGNEGAEGDVVLAIEVPERDIAPFEWIEQEKGYREFLVPADTLSRYPIVGSSPTGCLETIVLAERSDCQSAGRDGGPATRSGLTLVSVSLANRPQSRSWSRNR